MILHDWWWGLEKEDEGTGAAQTMEGQGSEIATLNGAEVDLLRHPAHEEESSYQRRPLPVTFGELVVVTLPQGEEERQEEVVGASKKGAVTQQEDEVGQEMTGELQLLSLLQSLESLPHLKACAQAGPA